MVRTKLSRAVSDRPNKNTRQRYAAGRRIKVVDSVKTVRDILRRHLREEGRDQKSLATVWDVKPDTVNHMFWERKRPFAPQHIDAFIEELKLDEFDAMELRWQAAIEAGWQLDKRHLLAGRRTALREARGEK